MVEEKSRAQRRQNEVGIDEEGATCLSAWRYRLHLNEHCSEQGHRKQQGSYWTVLGQVPALAPGHEPEPELLPFGASTALLLEDEDVTMNDNTRDRDREPARSRQRRHRSRSRSMTPSGSRSPPEKSCTKTPSLKDYVACVIHIHSPFCALCN